MFERFTPAAKELVIEAQAQRNNLEHEQVRTEHLLLALLVDDGPSGQVLRRQGLDAERIAAQLAELSGPARPTMTESDDRLLEGLGIDVESVRQRLDQRFGPGAFDRARQRRRPDRARSGRRAGHRRGGFDSRSKRVLELSLRESLRLKTRHIGPEHIGLGLLREGQGFACRLLVEHGAEPAELRSSWEAVALGARAR